MDNEPLVLDLVEWVAERPRPYAEVMEAWRTSCPRLTVWEDAVDAGLVDVRFAASSSRVVFATEDGVRLLRARGRVSVSPNPS